MFGRRRSLVARIQDGSGTLTLRFFHFSAAQKDGLRPGTRLRCFGQVRRGSSGLEMFHPEYRPLQEGEQPVEEALTPIYPTTAGIGQNQWRNLCGQALARLAQDLDPALAAKAVDLLARLPGTIVHEGSHVIACLLFGHRVDHVKWFDPQAVDGALGSVEHSYNRDSAYQRVGTIVIGIAPLLAGAAVLWIAARLLLGVPVARMAGMTAVPLWRWALFAYVSLSVGGSMHLSASDVRGTWRGVVTLGIWLGALVLLSLVLLLWV